MGEPAGLGEGRADGGAGVTARPAAVATVGLPWRLRVRLQRIWVAHRARRILRAPLRFGLLALACSGGCWGMVPPPAAGALPPSR